MISLNNKNEEDPYGMQYLNHQHQLHNDRSHHHSSRSSSLSNNINTVNHGNGVINGHSINSSNSNNNGNNNGGSGNGNNNGSNLSISTRKRSSNIKDESIMELSDNSNAIFGKSRNWIDQITDQDIISSSSKMGNGYLNLAPSTSSNGISPALFRSVNYASHNNNLHYDHVMGSSSGGNGKLSMNGNGGIIPGNLVNIGMNSMTIGNGNGNNTNGNASGNQMKFVNSTVEHLQNQIKKEEAPKKKRTRTTPEQLRILQKAFQVDPMPNSTSRQLLSKKLGMNARAVQVWFQNRRAKGKLDAKRTSPSPSSQVLDEIHYQHPFGNTIVNGSSMMGGGGFGGCNGNGIMGNGVIMNGSIGGGFTHSHHYINHTHPSTSSQRHHNSLYHIDDSNSHLAPSTSSANHHSSIDIGEYEYYGNSAFTIDYTGRPLMMMKREMDPLLDLALGEERNHHNGNTINNTHSNHSHHLQHPNYKNHHYYTSTSNEEYENETNGITDGNGGGSMSVISGGEIKGISTSTTTTTDHEDQDIIEDIDDDTIENEEDYSTQLKSNSSSIDIYNPYSSNENYGQMRNRSFSMPNGLSIQQLYTLEQIGLPTMYNNSNNDSYDHNSHCHNYYFDNHHGHYSHQSQTERVTGRMSTSGGGEINMGISMGNVPSSNGSSGSPAAAALTLASIHEDDFFISSVSTLAPSSSSAPGASINDTNGGGNSDSILNHDSNHLGIVPNGRDHQSTRPRGFSVSSSSPSPNHVISSNSFGHGHYTNPLFLQQFPNNSNMIVSNNNSNSGGIKDSLNGNRNVISDGIIKKNENTILDFDELNNFLIANDHQNDHSYHNHHNHHSTKAD